MIVAHHFGVSPQKSDVSTIEYFSVLVPLAGLYFGIKNYRDVDCKGKLGFLEALVQSF
jgi:hypothetical protein